MLRLPRKMTMVVSNVLLLPRKMQLTFWKRNKSIAPATKRVSASWSATPATQNDITTSFDNFEKERIGSFPHRHGDATRKPENWDETCFSYLFECVSGWSYLCDPWTSYLALIFVSRYAIRYEIQTLRQFSKFQERERKSEFLIRLSGSGKTFDANVSPAYSIIWVCKSVYDKHPYPFVLTRCTNRK